MTTKTIEKLIPITLNLTRTYDGSVTLYIPETVRQKFLTGDQLIFWDQIYLNLRSNYKEGEDTIGFDEMDCMDCESRGIMTDPTKSEMDDINDFVLEDGETITSLKNYSKEYELVI